MPRMRDRYSASDERCVRMRDINRQAYLLHSEFGQARQNFPSIAIFIEPRRQVRRTPFTQCLRLFRLSSGPSSFGNRTVSSDAAQFRLLEKTFSIHGRNAFRAIQRAGCDICTAKRTTGVCLGDRQQHSQSKLPPFARLRLAWVSLVGRNVDLDFFAPPCQKSWPLPPHKARLLFAMLLLSPKVAPQTIPLGDNSHWLVRKTIPFAVGRDSSSQTHMRPLGVGPAPLGRTRDCHDSACLCAERLTQDRAQVRLPPDEPQIRQWHKDN